MTMSPSVPVSSSSSVSGSIIFMMVPGRGMPTLPGLLNVSSFRLSFSRIFGIFTAATGAVSVAPYPS